MAASNVIWKVVALSSGVLSARLTRSVLDKTWARTRGGDPPRNPAAPGTEWREAILWSVASGTALALTRMLATQGAAKAWHRTTGKLPPGIESVGA